MLSRSQTIIRTPLLVLLLLGAILVSDKNNIKTLALSSSSKPPRQQTSHTSSSTRSTTRTRRGFLVQSCTTFVVLVSSTAAPHVAVAASSQTSTLSELRALLLQSKDQLQPVPKLIEQEKWDSIRQILIAPPVSDFWAKSSNTKALLQTYASLLGDAGGDDLAALELREEITSHLRSLDMAAYNNVFNPINSFGTTGATKELVRSYYEDPMNEYKASISVFEQLISLSDGLAS